MQARLPFFRSPLGIRDVVRRRARIGLWVAVAFGGTFAAFAAQKNSQEREKRTSQIGQIQQSGEQKQSSSATAILSQALPRKMPFNFTFLRGFALWEYDWDVHPATLSEAPASPPESNSPEWRRVGSPLFSLEGTQPAWWGKGAAWFRLRLCYKGSGDTVSSAPNGKKHFSLVYQIVGASSAYLDGEYLASVGNPASGRQTEEIAPFAFYHLESHALALTPNTTHELLVYYTFTPIRYNRYLGGLRASPPLGMKIALASPNDIRRHNNIASLFWFFFQGTTASVVLIGFIHFFLYVGGERYREHLIIVVLTCFLSAQSFSFYLLHVFVGQPLWAVFAANSLLVTIAPLSLLLVVAFLHEAYAPSYALLRWSVFTSAIVVVCSLLRIDSPKTALVVNSMIAACIAFVIAAVIGKIVRLREAMDAPERRALALAIALYVLAFLGEIVWALRQEYHLQRPLASMFELVSLYVPIPLALSYAVTRRMIRLRQQLEQSNRELESRVQERTSELRAANIEIEEQLRILAEQAREIEFANTRLQEQNLALQEADKEKSEFLGIAAHDLKNPLTAIRMMIDLMLRYENDMTWAKKRERLERIMTTTDRMTHIITNLLEVNALERGALQMQIVPVNMVALCETVTEDFRERAATKQIVVHLETFPPEAERIVALADAHSVRQILDNLISNAVKYSPQGKNVFVRVKSSENAVRVEVQDEGPGISEEDMKKLFGKFARLSAQPTGGEHSTGLGLSIVKNMVEAMNGRVWCESELGTGATFIVELPKDQ